MSTYDPGDGVTVYGSFTDEAGEPTDPTSVYLDVRLHVEDEPTTYTYGVDLEVVRDAEGEYHALLEPAEPGLYHYGWRGTGALVAAGQSEFEVRPWRPGAVAATS